MELIKTILILLISLCLGFGIWFLLGWFLSNEFNIMLWPWYGKLLYLWVCSHTTVSFSDKINEL